MAASPLVCIPRRSQRLAANLSNAAFFPPIELKSFAKNLVVRAFKTASHFSSSLNGDELQQGALVVKKSTSDAKCKRSKSRVGVIQASDQNHSEGENSVQELKRYSQEAAIAVDGSDANEKKGITEPKSKKMIGKRRRKTVKIYPSRDMEARLWQQGFQRVAGVDEAGRGPLAGPVVAAACIIPEDVIIDGIDDSKKLREEERERLFEVLVSTPGVSYAVYIVEARTIDEVNILQATMQAMKGSIQQLFASENSPDYVLVDGNRLPSDLPPIKAEFVIKGDAVSHVISAASILAKVTRDRLMNDYDKKWPEYGFKAHKGYGTPAHLAALLKCGPCHIHRKSFAPIKDWKQFSL